MLRAKIRNHTFDWMGEKFAPMIDRDHFLGHSAIGFGHRRLPPANIKEGEKLFELELMIPGFERDEILVTVHHDILTVKGEKKEKHRQSSRFILEEFQLEAFERRFRLGHGIGREHVEAKYENGILKISFIDVSPAEEKAYQEVKVS